MLLALQLKLREALLPEVVSQVDHLEGQASSSNGSRPQASSNGKKGKGKSKGSEGSGRPLKSWAANPKLFPCDVSPEAQKLVDEVQPCAKVDSLSSQIFAGQNSDVWCYVRLC